MNSEPSPSAWQPILSYTPNYLSQHLELMQLVDPPLFQILTERESRLPSVEIQIENRRPMRARTADGEIWDFIPSPEFIRGFRSKLQSLARQPLPFLVLAGTGYGTELMLLHETIAPLPNTIVLALEQNLLAVLIALTLYDCRQTILNGYIVWAIGNLSGERLTEIIQRHALHLLFSARIEIIFGSTAQEASVRKEYVESIQQSIRNLTPFRENITRSNQRFLESRKHRSARPTHVWSSGTATEYTSTPILKAIHRGLESVGMQSTFTELPRGRTRNLVDYQGLIQASPDTVFVLNDPSRLVIPQGEFHRGVWVTDDPSFRKNLRAAPRYDANEIVFYADPTYEPILAEQGAIHIYPLPVFALLQDQGQRRNELAYPLVFVGMIWNLEPFLRSLSKSDRDRLESIHAEILLAKTGSIGLRNFWKQSPGSRTLLDAAKKMYERCGRSPDEDITTLSYIVYMLDVYRRRWNMAEALLPLGLHVYGNKDWLSLLGARYADRYHGFARYEDLSDIYRSATVVVNIHSIQLPNALNIRDCDILMAGGCLLSDPIGEMNETTLFPGRDCETANAPREFAEKAQRLLQDHETRQRLIQQGHSKILRNFLPEHRAPMILNAFQAMS